MTIFMDDAPGVAAMVITLSAVGFVTYGLRCLVRIRNGTWGPEDWCITAAVVSLPAQLNAVLLITLTATLPRPDNCMSRVRF
jgi:hypothetical protein